MKKRRHQWYLLEYKLFSKNIDGDARYEILHIQLII
jgi:hypothetical protein